MLDDLAQIAKLDKSRILSSIERLPEQVEQSWSDVNNIKLPDDFLNAKNIIVSGMGGSGLGARVIRYLAFDRLRVPIEVVNGYGVPNYVNSESLVILSSYSGNTEETISSAMEAIKRQAKIIGITTGGKLEEILREQNLPIYKIDPKNNPSGQPRMGLGYSIMAILAILAKCNFLSLSDDEVEELVKTSEGFVKNFGVRTRLTENIAKKIAVKFSGKIPILFSSEHLVGVTHAMRNQINENSKNFSVNFKISEANHHLMEGLRFPHKARELLQFLFFESDLYHPRIQKRYAITKDVVSQNGFKYEVYKLTTKTKLEQAFELLIFGSYLSFYLAILYGIDPCPIPWVDYFKEKMEN